jgi:hypothetical protein
MKTLFLFASLLAAAGAGAACSSSSAPETSDADTETCPVYPQEPTCQNPKSPPSYKADVAPIIMSRCSPCHFPGGLAAAVYNFSLYDNVDNAGTAILNELAACSMPPIHGYPEFGIQPDTVPGISSAQVATLVEWIECGAPNN